MTTFTLCGTCRRAIFSWVTPSLFPGLPHGVEWSHYVKDEEHFAVPCRSIRDRILRCAVCRQPQVWHRDGWVCVNPHCEGSG